MSRKTKKHHTIGIHTPEERLDKFIKVFQALERGKKVKPLCGIYFQNIELLLKELTEKRLKLNIVASKLDEKGRLELGQLVLKAFNAWGLTNEQSCRLLGISRNRRSTLNGYSGKTPLPAKPGTITRALHIVRIYEILHCSNFKHQGCADTWPTLPVEELNGKGPVDVMMQSLPGMVRIKRWMEAAIRSKRRPGEE